MVCVPCIILPILVVIYVRFIQPLIIRFVPESWRTRIDAILYPTCPVNLEDRPRTTTENQTTHVARECETTTKSEESKKDE